MYIRYIEDIAQCPTLNLHYESTSEIKVNLIIVIVFVYTLYLHQIYISLLHRF